MNFQNSLEQTLLKASAATAFERLQAVDDDACSPILRALGVFGLMVPEEQGGSGLGLTEAAIVLQEMGSKSLRFPLAETVLLASHAILAHPDRIESILSGDAYIAAATTGSLILKDGRISGLIRVPDAKGATWIAAQADGYGIVLVPSFKLSGTHRIPVEPGVLATEVTVNVAQQEVTITPSAVYTEGMAILRCAEILGAAERCFELGLGYLKDRWQFGKPIGVNQALKHMAADTYLTLENCRIAVEYAAAAMDLARAAPDDSEVREDAEKAVKVMLCFVPRAAREIAETAVHFHGGIGLTWEYPLNRHLRRIVRLGMGLGSVDDHRSSLVDQIFSDQDATQHSSRNPHALQSDRT
jgi:alkylation response protein AidB-like acyl-CoA dehydrogenase